ncbi:MAG: RidA family protein [Actinomycetota bacterium]
MSADDRLRELGIELPKPPTPIASYVPVRVGGGLAFVSGMVPIEEGTLLATGRLGEEIDVERGAELARRCALQALAALAAELGSLDRIAKILKVTVWVSSTPEFTDQPKVANGASDLFVEVFGEAGKHARAAVSAPSLPLGAPVELDVVAELSD